MPDLVLGAIRACAHFRHLLLPLELRASLVGCWLSRFSCFWACICALLYGFFVFIFHFLNQCCVANRTRASSSSNRTRLTHLVRRTNESFMRRYPNLKQIALSACLSLYHPITSAFSERIFSLGGQECSEKRSSIAVSRMSTRHIIKPNSKYFIFTEG